MTNKPEIEHISAGIYQKCAPGPITQQNIILVVDLLWHPPHDAFGSFPGSKKLPQIHFYNHNYNGDDGMNKLYALIIAFGLTGMISACDNQGPAESAGEKIDQTVKNVQQEVQQMTEDTNEGTAEKIGESIDETAEQAAEKAQEVGESIDKTADQAMEKMQEAGESIQEKTE